MGNCVDALTEGDKRAGEVWDFNFDIELELNSLAIQNEKQQRPYFFRSEHKLAKDKKERQSTQQTILQMDRSQMKSWQKIVAKHLDKK